MISDDEIELATKRDIISRLNRLLVIDQQADIASHQADEANRRWNDARERYASEWADLVRTHGQNYAPPWFEVLRGPKPGVEANP